MKPAGDSGLWHLGHPGKAALCSFMQITSCDFSVVIFMS